MSDYLESLRAQELAPKPVKALTLLSGGLDSMLVVKLLLAQGIAVEAVNFNTGFCTVEYKRRLGALDPDGQVVRHECKSAAEQLGVPIEIVDISLDYLDVLMAPKYGYGSAANPCTDCRIFMLRRARELMQERGCHLVATGEVIGQRPKSQMKPTLRLIERDAGLEGFLLRPLSARNLPETVPERRGWVDREQLKDFTGRTRQPQLDLAARLGLSNFPSPAGGCCMLVEQAYANRFFDYLRYRGAQSFDSTDIILLRVGRHFRINDRLKVIVGRNQAENQALATYKGARPSLYLKDTRGPLALVDGQPTDDEKRYIAALVARYGDGPKDAPNRVAYAELDEEREVLEVLPLTPEMLAPMQLIATPKRHKHRGGKSSFDPAAIPAASLRAIEYKAELERAAHKRRARGASGNAGNVREGESTTGVPRGA